MNTLQPYREAPEPCPPPPSIRLCAGCAAQAVAAASGAPPPKQRWLGRFDLILGLFGAVAFGSIIGASVVGAAGLGIRDWAPALLLAPPLPNEPPPPPHARARHRRGRTTDARRTADVTVWPPSLLAGAGAATTEPRELLGRARRLAQAGLDLPILETMVSRAALAEAIRQTDPRVPRIAPSGRGIRSTGVKILRVEAGDLFGRVGLARGDIVTAVNGREVSHTDGAIAAWSQDDGDALIVVELVRGGRRMVLSILLT